MPVETVLHAKSMQCAAGSVHRAVISVCVQFWAGGAKLESMDESVAQQIARIPAGHWAAIKAPVMAALADILPELALRYVAAHNIRENMRAMLRLNGAKGRAITLARRKAREEIADGKPVAASRVALKTPHMAEKYVNPRACLSPQDLAGIPGGKAEARFLDK